MFCFLLLSALIFFVYNVGTIIAHTDFIVVLWGPNNSSHILCFEEYLENLSAIFLDHINFNMSVIQPKEFMLAKNYVPLDFCSYNI